MNRKRSMLMALVMILSFSVVSFGDGVLEKIQAYWAHDIKFEVDGKPWQPKEPDGSRLSPILYKGRTYVPARALLEEKDVKVAFNEETRTIHLDYPLWEPPPQDLPEAPEYEPPVPQKPEKPEYEPPVPITSVPYDILKSDIGGPYKEWPNYDLILDLLDEEGKQDGPIISNIIEIELADDAVFMINGKEDGDPDADGAVFYFEINPKTQIRLGVDPKSNLVKSVAMNLNKRKPGDKEAGRPQVKGLKSKEYDQGNRKLIIMLEPHEEERNGTAIISRPRR